MTIKDRVLRAKLLIFLFAFLLILSGKSWANFWCNGKIVAVGDTRFDILHKCGEPDFKERWYENWIQRDFYPDLFRSERHHRYRERELYREPSLVEEIVVIEEWIYNLGPARFVRYVIFENGVVVDIRTGGYGY